MSVNIENILYVGSNIKLVQTMLNAFHGQQNKATYKTCHLLSAIDIEITLSKRDYQYFICELPIPPEVMARVKTKFPQLKSFYLADPDDKQKQRAVSLKAKDLTSKDVQAALDAISIPIYYRNEKRVFLACNVAFSRLLGLMPEQVVGKHFLELFPTKILQDIKVIEKIDSPEQKVTLYEGKFNDIKGAPREMELRLESLSERNLFIGMVFDVQEKNDAKRLVEKEQARLRATADISSLLIFFKDLDSRFLGCNKPFEKFVNCSEKDIIGKKDELFFTPEQAISCQVQDEKVMTENTVFCSEEYLTAHNGERHFVKMKKVPILAKDGSVQGLIAVAQDITAKNILRKNLNVANVVFENSKDSIIVTDARGKIISANNSASEIFGYENQRLLAEDIRLLYSDNHNMTFYKGIEETLKSDKRWQGEVSYTTHKGDVYYAWLEIYIVEHLDEGTVEKIYSYTDLTQFQSEQERILFLSKHDPQTGLYNRVALFHRLETAINRATYKELTVAVMLINLDDFHMINVDYGHNTGDNLLKEVALRLKSCLSEKDILARFVGDRFVIIVDELLHEQDAALVAQTVAEQFDANFHVDGFEIDLSASIGISLFPDDGMDVDSLLSNANQAMLRGKTDKTTKSHFYTNELTQHSNHQLELEQELKQALELDQFELYYQPQYDLNKKLIVAMDCSMHWNHPQQGVLLPIQFDSLIESSGLIVPVGLSMLRKAMQQAVKWRKKGIYFGRISIKIDKAILMHAGFISDLLSLLKQTGCEIKELEFELEETVLAHDSVIIQENLSNINKIGIALTLAAYGYDRSILFSLEKLNIEKVKISSPYFQNMPGYLTRQAMFNSTKTFARTLGLDVVVNDVENTEQKSLTNAQYSHSEQSTSKPKVMRAAEATFYLNSHKHK